MAPQGAPAKKRIVHQRVTGKVTAWKGKFGWIQAVDKIKHPDAAKNGGKIYLSAEDVEQDIPGVGSMVTFFVYTDGKGLGAQKALPVKGPVKNQASKKGKQSAQGSKFQKKPQKPAPQKNAPPPDKSNREVLTTEPVSGTVKKGGRNVYFVKPDEPFDHPEAKKHGGLIYLHQDDLEGSEKPTWNAKVSFYVYTDGVDKGLGAERCDIVEQGTDTLFDGRGRGGKEGKAGSKSKVRKTALKKGSKWQTRRRQPRKDQPPPDKSTREVLSTIPVSGVVKKARGNVYFIKPDEPFDHPDNKNGRGQIFLHHDDLEGSEAPKFMAKVMFFVYSDGKGLGAERCEIVEQGDEDLYTGGESKASKGGQKKGVKKPFLKQKTNKAKKKEPKEPSGPELPRERVKDSVTGEVKVWRKNGKFGFIMPSEPIDHPKASKKDGMIYVHKKDVAEGVEMSIGLQVQFNVFSDSSGLGAEDCFAC